MVITSEKSISSLTVKGQAVSASSHAKGQAVSASRCLQVRPRLLHEKVGAPRLLHEACDKTDEQKSIEEVFDDNMV